MNTIDKSKSYILQYFYYKYLLLKKYKYDNIDINIDISETKVKEMDEEFKKRGIELQENLNNDIDIIF